MTNRRPRINVRRTPEIEHALEIAAAEWPGVPRSVLLANLAIAGAKRHAATTGADADAPAGMTAERRADS